MEAEFHSLVLNGGKVLAENSIEKKAEELLSKIIQDMGYDLYDIEYVKEGKEYHLCIYIE